VLNKIKELIRIRNQAHNLTQINVRKFTFSVNNMEADELSFYQTLFPYEIRDLDLGLKYLRFQLKPNFYMKSYWFWRLANLEKRLKSWSYRFLSRAGRLVLFKYVLESIHVYWMSLAWISKGFLEKIRRIWFKFLWVGSKENFVLPWVEWESLEIPEALGGRWGLIFFFLFSKSLVAKYIWILISREMLWTNVFIQKYIHPEIVVEWIRNPQKKRFRCSIIWKVIINSFDVVGC
jgi:hypothetical protein